MSEDLERQLRQAFHDAPLPGAPSTLRETLQGVPDAAPLRGSASRWQRLPLALAAVLAVAVVGLAGVGLLGKLPLGPVGPSGSGLATEPPPPASVQVLDDTQLAAAITAQRAGGLEPQVVVTSDWIDASRKPQVTLRECGLPTGSCTVIGVLGGMQDPEGTVTVRMPDGATGDIPPPTSATDLAGPVALRLAGTAPIEFLGHMGPHGPTAWGVRALLAATATVPAGQVLAVDGWLVGIEMGSCGPVIDPPLPAPFMCPTNRSVLTAAPVLPVRPYGSNGITASVPDGAVQVQAWAYDSFAQSPAHVGINDVPREGMYLVRMVTVDRTECPACRGWLIVGRLDAAPAPTSSGSSAPAAATVEVLSVAQATARLAADRASLVGQPMIIDGNVGPRKGLPCVATDPWCVLGRLDGTSETVFATSFTNAQLGQDSGGPLGGVLAYVVRDTGLEYLGRMGYYNGAGFEFPISGLDASSGARGPMVVVARGWLVAGLPVPCPAPMPGTPQNTPFETCPPAWLTQDNVQPVVKTPNSVSYNEPAVGVHVQYTAYSDLAPDPGNGADGLVNPRFGTYLVRLVFDPRQPEATAPHGWQVVGRLDPGPAVGPPLSAPLPSRPPDPSATPRPDPVVTCIPESNPAFGGDPCPSAMDAALAAANVVTALPVTRLYLQPGIFPCGKHWGEPATCAGAAILRGRQMYGWMAFDGTGKVAAVQLRRELPTADMPQPPWTATIEAFDVPPAGWSMP